MNAARYSRDRSAECEVRPIPMNASCGLTRSDGQAGRDAG
jgi:hypothetical protein